MPNSVRVSIGLTVNLGNYNSGRVTLEVEKEVVDGERSQDVMDELYDTLEDALFEKVGKLTDRFEGKREQIF